MWKHIDDPVWKIKFIVNAKQGKELNQENNKSQTFVVDHIMYDVTVCIYSDRLLF
jgi:hypothetical protein